MLHSVCVRVKLHTVCDIKNNVHKIIHSQYEKIPLSWKILHSHRGQRGRVIWAVCTQLDWYIFDKIPKSNIF